MDTKKLAAFLEVMKSLTGSIMTHEKIMDEYKSITPAKRAYIYSKVHQIVKHMAMPFDKAQPLVAVSINVIAAEENVDPAVVLFIYMDKKNKKRR